jgi:glutamate carboxypeptidase
MALPSFISALAARDDELRDLVIDWASQNSGSENPSGLALMLQKLESAFSSLPGSIERLHTRNSPNHVLRVRCRPEASVQVILSGHYDTVYGADHPFQTCTLLDKDQLRGPGVIDMKGGIVVMLAALQAFERSSHAQKIGWEVILGPDEEIGSQGTRPYLEEAGKHHDFAMVFEPCRENGDLVNSRKGTGIFTLTCHGRAAHAGRNPGAGRNAILALAELLPHVDALNQELPGIMINIGRIRGGGAVNIVPDLAEADLNLRITRSADGAMVLSRLRGLAAPINAREGFKLDLTGQFNRNPKESTPAEEALFSQLQACGKELGLQFGWQPVDGGSDGNLLWAAGLPTLDGLGVHGGGMHSSEECLSLDSLVSRAQLASLFLERIASGEIAVPARQRQRSASGIA